MRWTLAPLLLVPFWACGSSGTSVAPVDADPIDADVDGGLPCDTSGVSKGPWVLHVDGASAIVRWESCRAATDTGVTYVPEAGGATKHFVGTETPFVVKTTIKVFNTDATPDYAGTWYMHDAPLSGLSPSTCYTYNLDADPKLSGRFCTARNPGDTVRFYAIGDTNPALGFTTRDILSHTVGQGFDFALHGGDIEYYDSLVETYAYWFELMPPLLRGGAFLPAIGNHDSDDQSGEPDDKWEQYTERFWGNAGFDGANEYYAYNTGGIWFLTLDTEEDIMPGSVQYAWVESELQKASASAGYRFSIYYQHRPFLTCGDTGDHAAALAAIQPLFTKYKVPLVIQAHMHGYERFELPGLTIVTTGGGGGAIGNVNANMANSYCNERVKSGAFPHAMLFEITPGMLSATVIDDQGNTQDQFAHPVP